jgi:hypothetical protein
MKKKFLSTIIFGIFLVAFIANYSCAEDVSGWSDVRLISQINGKIFAIIEHEENIIIGGNFTQINNRTLEHIALYKPYSSTWQPIGQGLDGDVRDIIIYNGNLVACGEFPGYVAQFDGNEWSILGNGKLKGLISGTLPGVEVVYNYSGNLIIGGNFITVNTVTYGNQGLETFSYIAQWDGEKWNPMGDFWSLPVFCFGTYQNHLAAGGKSFGLTDSVAYWSENHWVSYTYPSDFLSGIIFDIQEYNGDFYIGGWITTPPFEGIARYVPEEHRFVSVDGGVWGGWSTAKRLDIYKNKLVVAGDFNRAGQLIGVNNIVFWDGQEWQKLGGGLDDHVHDLFATEDRLYVVGDFIKVDGKKCMNLVWYEE